MDHWAMRSTNNPQGRFCDFHSVFITRRQSQPSLTSEKKRSTKSHAATRCSLKASNNLRVTKGLWYSISACVDVNSCHHLVSATSCFHSCFTCYHLMQTLCVSSEDSFLSLSHPTSWLLDCCSPPPSLPPSSSLPLHLWGQAAGVLWLEDQRASERRSLWAGLPV